MRRLLTLVLCGFACLMSVRGLHAQVSDREQQARDTAKSYFQALAAKDLDAMMALWHPDAPGYAERKKVMANIFAETGPIELKDVRFFRFRRWSRSGLIEVRVTLVGDATKTKQPHPSLGTLNRVLELKRVGRAWKIWKYEEYVSYYLKTFAALPTKEERLLWMKRERSFVSSMLWNILSYAGAYQKSANFEEAMKFSDLSLEVADFLGSVEKRAWCELCRGWVLLRHKKYDEAKVCYERAREGFRREQQDTGEAIVQCHLGVLYLRSKQHAKALEAFEAGNQLLTILPYTATRDGLHQLGVIWLRLANDRIRLEKEVERLNRDNRRQEAVEVLRKLDSAVGGLFGRQSPAYADFTWTVVRMRGGLGEFEPARYALKLAKEINLLYYPADHPRLITLRELGKWLDQVSALSPEDWKRYQQNALVSTETSQLEKEGKLAEVEQRLQKQSEVLGELLGTETARYAIAIQDLAYFYKRTKQWDKANETFRRVDAMLCKHYGETHPNVTDNVRLLANVLRAQYHDFLTRGKFAKAVKAATERHELFTTRLSEDTPGFRADQAVLQWYIDSVKQIASLAPEQR